LNGGSGADTLYGGAGNDVATYAAATAAVNVSLATGLGSGNHATGDVLFEIEHLIGSIHADTLTGDGGANSLFGGAGNDSLVGGDGNDTLIGGAGSDRLFGGNGFDSADYSTSTAGVSVNLTTGLGSGGYAAGDTLAGIEAVIGSGFADTLIGAAGDESLVGGAGNDSLTGGAGADTLDGGAGIDWANYASSGAAVNVNLAAGTGAGGDAAGDLLSGIENLEGSAFNDTQQGDGLANSLSGGSGDDLLIGGGGADTLVGGLGIDTADYSASGAGVDVALTGALGLGGDAAGDSLSGIENLTGSSLNDTLTGDGAANILDGGAGNDLLQSGLGADTLRGGIGNDTATYAAATAGVSVNLATGATGGFATGDTLDSIENLVGSGFDDTLSGDAGANLLDGGAGNDVLAGGAGADTLIGGAGLDSVDYSASNAAVTVNLATGSATGGDATGDVLSQIESILGSSYADLLTGDGNANTLTGGAGDDSLYGGAGSDSLFGGDGNDFLQGGAGSDRLEGGAGIDTADYSDSTAAVNVNLATGLGSGGSAATDTLVGVENLFGSAFNDSLYGSTGNNFIRGGLGNDLIEAGNGDDILNGGAGRDSLYGGQGMDYLDYTDSNAAVSINLGTGAASGGHATGDVLTGVDGIFGSVFDDTLIGFDNQGLVGDVYTNVFFGGGGNDYIDVGGGDDIAFGDEGNDTIFAGSGDDIASGGEGNDALYGGSGNDTADGDTGDDLIDGGTGNDSVTGGEGNDSLYGVAGNDSLFGGDGNDLIAGGAGADSLVGGAGSDTFVGGIGDTVVGGAGDNDVLDLSGAGPYRIIKTPGDRTTGTVEFLDAFGNVIGTLSFSGIEAGVACFTPGTRVATPEGPRAIESLRPGDSVLTRDRGYQPIRWIGHKRFETNDLQANAALQPILIRKGALGRGLPERDMKVSRQDCLLQGGSRAELYFGEDEVFVRALHMVGQPGIVEAVVQEVTYIHLMFDHHEVILADGIWSESFQPAARNIGGLDDAARDELFAVFAEMSEPANPEAYVSARLTLKAHEARLLLSPEAGHRKLGQRRVA
ncbi:MAG: hypothetical protein FJX28_13155, partial [Alphaproteobacteria bacterium]|nr:hypothetical protein [Alphaproteobacteria bacterium]